MDKHFGEKAAHISSRAIAVSAYLFIEDLYMKRTTTLIPHFVKFYLNLLSEIRENMALLSNYEKPSNTMIMEGFQKYILQASVEPSSIRRRHEFLKRGFKYYTDARTKGELIGSN